MHSSFDDASRPNARCFLWLKAEICHSWDLPDASHNFHLTHNRLTISNQLKAEVPGVLLNHFLEFSATIFDQLPATICSPVKDLPNQLVEMQLLVKLKKMTDWHWRLESKCGEIERNGKLRRIDTANGI